MLRKYRILIGALAAMIVSGIALATVPANAQMGDYYGRDRYHRRFHRRYRPRHWTHVREVYWRRGHRHVRWVGRWVYD